MSSTSKNSNNSNSTSSSDITRKLQASKEHVSDAANVVEGVVIPPTGKFDFEMFYESIFFSKIKH